MTDDSDSDETVELDSVDYSEINDSAMTVFETMADQLGLPVTALIDQLEQFWSVDPTEITEDQADKLLEANEEADPELAGEALEEIGVPEEIRKEAVESFREVKDGEIDLDEITDQATSVDESDDDGDDESDDDETEPDRFKQGSGPSYAEVQEMIQQSQQETVNEVVDRIQQELPSGGGQPDGDAGASMQQRMALELAKNVLGPQQPANPGTEQMAQAQQQMMEGFGSIMQGIAEGISENMEIRFDGKASASDAGIETEEDDDE